MSSSLRRGTLAATALVLSAATLTACAAGNDAETLQIQPDNAAASVGDIKIQAVNVITTGKDGDGPAAVTAKLFNTSDKAETLQGISIDVAGVRVELAPAKGETLKVPAHGALALGGKGNASALILTGTSALENGSAPRLSFDLSRTGSVKLRATVMPEEHGTYEDFGPTVKPTEPSPSQTPGGESTDTPEGTEGAEGTEGTEGGEQPAPDASAEGEQGTQEEPGAQEEPAPGASAPAEEAAGTDAGH